MCEPTTMIALGGGFIAAGASVKAGEENQAIANQNAAIADRAATDANDRGQHTAAAIEAKGTQIVAKEETTYAASGVDASKGSAADVEAGSRAMAELDAQTARNNAAKEAWGYRKQGENFRNQGQQAYERGVTGAFTSILGAAGQGLGGVKGGA